MDRLASEVDILKSKGPSEKVIDTMLSVRKPDSLNMDPATILDFLQEGFEMGVALSTF